MSESKSTSIVTKKFRTQYGGRRQVQKVFVAESRTKQEFQEECDINRIMAQYQRTGVLPVDPYGWEPRYMDCTGLDYQVAMETVAYANSMFQSLSSKIRDRFDNDPQKFLEFAQDPAHQEEMIEMGLARRIEPSARVQATGVASSSSGELVDPPKATVEGKKGEDKAGK